MVLTIKLQLYNHGAEFSAKELHFFPAKQKQKMAIHMYTHKDPKDRNSHSFAHSP